MNVNFRSSGAIISPFILIFILFANQIFGQETGKYHVFLPGFHNSVYFNEQVKTFYILPDVRVQINASAENKFDPAKQVELIFYALPNGNSIEQTAGKKLQPDDDWHFDIQHIAAQTRFLRSMIAEVNLVTVYLEAAQKSWPAWKALHPDYQFLVSGIIDSLTSIFEKFDPVIVLNGHSGGGRFIFSLLDAYDKIPNRIKRISFLDSDYGYETCYRDKIVGWLKSSEENVLSVIAYNDSIALYKGERFVSDTGGTWYRSKLMITQLSDYFKFEEEEDSNFIKFTALKGRIKFILKKNPYKEILHTVQVERNGFIQSICQATHYENKNYVYYGDRVYGDWIQSSITEPAELKIPPRARDALSGSEFMRSVDSLGFEEREERIFNEISNGNIPDFLRLLKNIESEFYDAAGIKHTVIYKVMPDYLSIGSDEDYCRIPMGPITAQKLADKFGASLPTAKLVDDIYAHSEIKLSPFYYAPVGNQNELAEKFVHHNKVIDALIKIEGGINGQLISGIKKDVVISNKILDPERTHHVNIYGWHKLDGKAIQPLTNVHINIYVDYSHGIRLINSEILLDGKPAKIQDVLKDKILFKVLSGESSPMRQPSYLPADGFKK